MIITEETYLEHHGVKGMRWGIRNQDRDKSDGLSKETKKKILVGAGVTAVVGGVAVGLLLNHNRKIHLSQISKTKANIGAFNSFWDAHKNGPIGLKKVKSLPRLHVNGVPTSHEHIMKGIATERITSITKANEQLKLWNNRNDVPILSRKYLDPSHWKDILDR